MIQRPDLDRVIAIVQERGFRLRHTAGLDMLIYGKDVSARNAVPLRFRGEKVRPTQATPNLPISPERKQILGTEVCVIPLADLLQMKLSAYRDQDRVHTRIMDAAGLITPAVEAALSPELQARLQHVRATE